MFASPVPSALKLHASSACEAVRALDVVVRALEGERLALGYVLDADLTGLRIPPARDAHRAHHELWRHTCFEAFLRVAGSAGYCELNFAPSQAWAMYRFSGRREGMAVVTNARPPEVEVRRTAAGLTLEATVFWPDLVGTAKPLRLRIAAAAVLEDDSGSLSYWALRHPSAQPDFHHPDGFILELDL